MFSRYGMLAALAAISPLSRVPLIKIRDVPAPNASRDYAKAARKSRYMPHQGNRERARRRRQMDNGQLTGLGIVEPLDAIKF